ncbi:MAG: ABC transporter permease [Gemmatimonadetes bacterium]|nr:ABC transporter permease [Gemmatimonadota bacterium]
MGPAAVALVFLFLLPLAILAGYAVLTTGEQGEPILPFTLVSLTRALDPLYLGILARSLRLSLETTAICLLLGLPLAWILRGMRGRARSLALLAVILPSWTNLLVKNYAWIVLLRQEGVVNSLLVRLGLVSEPLPLLFNEGAVLAGLVHTFLPFMVLPLYASFEKLDPALLEAARDLGAGGWERFRRVIVPLSAPGIGAGVTLVFVPALGAVVTPDLLGGARGMMIGNLIQNQMLLTQDWPFGSALAVALTIASLVVIILALGPGRRGERVELL